LQNSDEFKSFSRISTPELRRFIIDSHKSSPSLFSDIVNGNDIAELYAEVSVVFSAWTRLQRMRKSKEKWSEADFVSNV
jgi:solute carrier family 25 (mitochondrial carnitine/acylcarnitine transporter), member 20/29